MANLTEQETARKTDFEKELQLAEQGDADAQVGVGLSYQYGRGTNKNSAQAIEWLKKAAIRGDEFGQYLLGEMYLKNKDFIQAANWLEKASERGDKNAQILLVRACLENITVTQNFSQAIKWLDTVLTNAPKFIDELISKTISDAEDKKDNFSTYYWSREIEKYYALPEYERIAETYRKLLANKFERPKFTQTNNLEKLAYQEGATAKIQFVAGILCGKDNLPIVDLIKQAAERGETDAQYILADFYFDGLFGVENNQALAWQWFKKAQQQNNDNFYTEVKWFEKKEEEGNANSYIKRADAYYSYFRATHDDSNKKLDLFRKALADYTKAIELNPNEADFYIKRADAYHNSGYELYYYDDYDTLCKSDIFYKALNDYTKSIELNPNCYNAYYARAMFHQQVDYFFICDEQALNAIPDYTKVIELAPDEDYAYYNRAQCYQFLKEYNKAIADYSKSIELNDKHNIYCERGYCYEELKEYDKAITDYFKEIESEMDYPFSFPYFRRANCYHNLKKYDEALADYSKGFKLGKGITSRDFFSGGELYKELGDYERAFKCFDYGIKSCKDSKDTEKYTYLALSAAMSINDHSRAKNYIKQLTSLEHSDLKKHEEVYLGNIDKAEKLEKLNQELKLEIQQKEAALEAEKVSHKKLHEKEQEMISFFTHTLRNALASAPESLRQAIRLLGSEDYEKNKKYYKAINKITALFSTLSLTDCLIDTFKQSINDPQEFKLAWQKDNTGDATPKWVIASALRQSLNRIIFMSDASQLEKLLNVTETSAIVSTRKSFIETVLPLNIDNQGINTFYDWLNGINTIEIAIEETNHSNFGINQVKFSLLFAITSEILLNALKYWNGTGHIQISWQLIEENYIFTVKNPCHANASSNLAGTHKGIAFINRLMELLGDQAQFNCIPEEQQFTAQLKLHKSLLGDNT